MSLAEAARTWHLAGVSTIPVMANGTKRPAVRWGEYIAAPPSMEKVNYWWGNGQEYGLALICGKVSGGLEMTELEARAAEPDQLTKIAAEMTTPDLSGIWEILCQGYMEWTPSGGIHFLYRISDHDVPGNEKIAQDASNHVMAETRGEGGYVIVAPTSGPVHATGEPWTLVHGSFGKVPEITWEQRCLFHQALRAALDSRAVVPVPPSQIHPSAPLPITSPPGRRLSGATLTPGDDFELRTDWSDILEPHGWSLEHSRGQERHWTRPGKSPREGASATTGRANDRDRLYVFSTSTVFEANTCYTKFAAHAILNFGGNFHAAAVELASRGYGSRAVTPPELEEWIIDGVEYVDPYYRNNDDGNGRYLRDRIRNRYAYVRQERQFYVWDGKVWAPDLGNSIEYEFKILAREMCDRAEANGDEKALKRWVLAGNMARIQAAVNALKTEPTMTIGTEDLNPDRHLVNLDNGILNLEDGQLHPHDPGKRMTRTMGAAFDPQAACPNFDQFIEQVLPDEATRDYVQRAVGYTLLGDADQRAMFLIHGPSGTGKSQFVRIMEMVFGDYAATAPPGTFKMSRDKAPSNDLHRLRGRRFVSTSETADNASFDEDLLKRITGRDQISSRGLYQEYQEWTPECSLWLATNHPPRFNSDDDAIWRRAKLIPFTTQFGREQVEIPDIARKILQAESDGILNWILEGVREFQARGLDEPDPIRRSSSEHRSKSDSVVRFLDDKINDGVLVLQEHERVSLLELYNMYSTWSQSVGEHRLGSRRFMRRLESCDYPITRTPEDQPGTAFWIGLGRARMASLLGSFMT